MSTNSIRSQTLRSGWKASNSLSSRSSGTSTIATFGSIVVNG